MEEPLKTKYNRFDPKLTSNRYLHDQIVSTSHRACTFDLEGYVYLVGGELDPKQFVIMNGNIFQYTNFALPLTEPDPLCVSTGKYAFICGKNDNGLLSCFSFGGYSS